MQSSSTTESTPPSRPTDQAVPARERALKQWRGDAATEFRREADKEARQPDRPAHAPDGQSGPDGQPRRGLLR
ncbi:MAG: HlyD family secretion protein, partial [Bradyrhizobium sp.]|nr:HlyD family secretion protein [Bradyrhizobium sp.]